MSELKIKDPGARLDYAIDWGPFLDGTDGDTIAEAAWEADDGIDVEDEGLDDAGRRHVAFVSGGEHGVAYTLTSKIKTTQGREDDLSLRLYVRST
jgi:hypothetical protein